MEAILAEIIAFSDDQGGTTTVEYAVMLALVTTVVITVVGVVGTRTNALFQEFNDEFDAAR